MRDNSSADVDSDTGTKTPGTSGDNRDVNSAGPTPAQAAVSPANSNRDAAADSMSEAKGRDPEYYAERDVPSERDA
jgi:hypothetical protein